MPGERQHPDRSTEVSNNDLAGMIESMASDVRLVKHYCTGGDDPAKGLIVRVDRLEQQRTDGRIGELNVRMDTAEGDLTTLKARSSNQKWWMRTVITAAVGVLILELISWIKGHAP